MFAVVADRERVARGMTIADLAHAAGTHRSIVSAWLSGRRTLRSNHLERICKILKIEPAAKARAARSRTGG